MEKNYGTFSARAYTAGGALPIDGAVVRIMGAEEANRLVSFSLLTDRDGRTERISLPAPSKIYSEVPDPSEAPYYLYDLEISKEGYYPKRLFGITIFPDTYTEQMINMIPKGEGDFPLGNINADLNQGGR